MFDKEGVDLMNEATRQITILKAAVKEMHTASKFTNSESNIDRIYNETRRLIKQPKMDLVDMLGCENWSCEKARYLREDEKVK